MTFAGSKIENETGFVGNSLMKDLATLKHYSDSL